MVPSSQRRDKAFFAVSWIGQKLAMHTLHAAGYVGW
jgi:hypothetical protein